MKKVHTHTRTSAHLAFCMRPFGGRVLHQIENFELTTPKLACRSLLCSKAMWDIRLFNNLVCTTLCFQVTKSWICRCLSIVAVLTRGPLRKQQLSAEQVIFIKHEQLHAINQRVSEEVERKHVCWLQTFSFKPLVLKAKHCECKQR